MINIGSVNVLSPVQWQAINWVIDDLLSMESLGLNFSEILIEFENFSVKKINLKM